MRIIRHLHPCPEEFRHSVVALGNFDGVHKGHQEVVRRACQLAGKAGVPAAVMTFEPHPADKLRPGQPSFRIDNFRGKAEKLAELGVNVMFVPNFNDAFSQLHAEDFVRKILVETLAVKHVVTGKNFAFGHKRSGNSEVMQAMAARYGFGFTPLPPVFVAGEPCSSTRIRQALQAGDVTQAAALLGGWYCMGGRVRKGEARGRTLGFPTANIALKRRLCPAFGVYAVKVKVDGQFYPGVANIGKKPTFGIHEAMLEVHLLDVDIPLYGKPIDVYFIGYIRPESRFDGAEALVQQIKQDVDVAKTMLMG